MFFNHMVLPLLPPWGRWVLSWLMVETTINKQRPTAHLGFGLIFRMHSSRWISCLASEILQRPPSSAGSPWGLAYPLWGGTTNNQILFLAEQIHNDVPYRSCRGASSPRKLTSTWEGKIQLPAKTSALASFPSLYFNKSTIGFLFIPCQEAKSGISKDTFTP